jgi:hypothetical protein
MNLDARTIRILATLNNDAENAALLALDEPRRTCGRDDEEWQGSTDSNRGPSVLETDALTN